MFSLSSGYMRCMDREDEMSSRERTVAAMHDTAEQLEVVEGILHRSAEASPNEQTTHRLHALGDAVTEQARHIDERADQMPPGHGSRRATIPGRRSELSASRACD
jgi:hypothetical protein